MINNERERRMAMLRAALPYTMGQQRHALELLLQTDTLINTVWHGSTQNDLEACDMEARPEEMLLHIQEFCTPRESDLIQMALNFIKANRLFQNYREFNAAHTSTGANTQGDLHAAGYSTPNYNSPIASLLQLFGGLGNPGNSGNLMEFLISQLPSEQKQLFEQLRNFSTSEFGGDSFAGENHTENDFSTHSPQESPDGFSMAESQPE